MREISLHILDIIQNSIAAKASRVEVIVEADHISDQLYLMIRDNGRGMKPEMVARVLDPFTTTRTTRRVGLGLPMLAASCQGCEGKIEINSILGQGTEVKAFWKLSHIDRAPFGDIKSTMVNSIVTNPDVAFRYEQTVDGRSFFVDMLEVRRALGEEIPLESAPVVQWLRQFFDEGLVQTGPIL